MPFQDPDAETFPQPALGHLDGLAGLNFSVADGWRFFSQQLRGNPQRFYFLSHSYDFLLFHAKHFKGVFHGEGSFNYQHHQPSQASTVNPRHKIEKHHEGARPIS